ncbi:hypothetical protein K450DRAFT_259427 [Umbelopsis ramanniana AG]|uniref:Copper-fist domain-containing protein n=1 Tax=Umbelopsis ramanniana AG TaxID=1314678 RepID=A0AAD5HB82_UMBRA|nr:uncharacterized protein K450DRAFT_259427 [Umbelopsis ramanniana AG]KAI8575928.1 hypothetical protein K450DRAFT_259427 [Umbelopsis ramanniana AG]
MEHASHCTCKRSKKKSLRRPIVSPQAVDIGIQNGNLQSTPSPPSSSPSIQDPASWSWALIAPKQETDHATSSAKDLVAPLPPIDNNNDYSFVFHKSIEPKKPHPRRRSSLSRRPSPISIIGPHNLIRVPSSDSSVKSEPAVVLGTDAFNIYSASTSNETLLQSHLSSPLPHTSEPIFSDLQSKAVESLDFSLNDLPDDLAMLIDGDQAEQNACLPTDESDDITHIPISSASSISGEFTEDLANSFTFESAAELMAIFENDLSKHQQKQKQVLSIQQRRSNQSCCGSFAPSSACCGDLSLPGESVCITITPMHGQSQPQRPSNRIVTCRCGSSCSCTGCLVHAGSNWILDPYAGIPSSSCSSDEEDHLMLDEEIVNSSLPWLPNDTL